MRALLNIEKGCSRRPRLIQRMGEYVIYGHFKLYQIPLYHSTNKKMMRILKKGPIITSCAIHLIIT